MRYSSLSLPAFSLLLLLPTAVSAIQTLSAVGSKFFYENGTQYFMKGIAYQLVPDDPLIDTEQCERDISLMAQLGTNAIRVYHVDPSANHDGCMTALAAAGIYLFVDLDTFETQIEQNDPHWNQTQFDRFKEVLDEFQKYENTAGVFVGNEILTTKGGSAAAPYLLAAARDIKSYRDEKNYRNIPVGYSAADIAELRPMLQNYLACAEDPDERLDFYALNAYEWCGVSSYAQSGYRELQKNATGYPIPIFFSETGCNAAPPRTFEDQAAIFGDYMSDTWSGSMVYEWIQEVNHYGLITYGPPAPGVNTPDKLVYDGFTRKGVPTPVAPDFHNLKSQWATLSPTGVALSDYIETTSTITPPACPAYTAGAWEVGPNSPLPTLGQTHHKAGTKVHVTSVSGPNTWTVSNARVTMSSPSPSVRLATSSAARSLAAPRLDGSGYLAGASKFICLLVGLVAAWL
ncbi:putative 1,3-beta-glucanosyltransferase [Aspergillus clavatus NRRL 1]|uniref:1,3-beta-glucanosyltransferase n=1 Tax=Aspergillus clavatus (strain ATCC 1007 / CBS 513.65 / DSM 816 / NCTC 3887 / NRRL 1 / QM 1276 / 107) TaxID=344612 RepID=A1CL51_ASPCL|nr:1,3-beta-glucanosyltransferase, putative [Aspergillus clavatus NRRL 1]EAW09875.1 1,3-beta-glucanosyltransferase, putative [Aspergillus clavatus NRRL 1]